MLFENLRQALERVQQQFGDRAHECGELPKGATVLPATQSAMFDERMVDGPNEFRIGRPAYLDMHFGYGLHTCFGQYVNRVQIPGILKPLLKKGNVIRAGQLEYQGPFPSSLRVKAGN
jgi:cytochrome P450